MNIKAYQTNKLNIISMETKPVVLHVEEKEDDELFEPVSPTGQYFNSSVLSISIIAALESEIPIDDSVAIPMLNNVFLPISPRFSSVMVRADDGGKEWKKVDVRLEEHVKVPVFPNELSLESYDELLQGYLTKIGMEQLPQNRPLWDIHIFKYPTSNAAGTLVFRLHHALGDGYSLMGALFTCLQRADNPSLPLTFPCSQLEPKKPGQTLKSVVGLLSVMLNTAKDFSSSLLKSSVLKDHVTPIRSAAEGKEFHPVTISTVTFSMEQIKQIRSKLGGTINDVIVGVIFYGTRLYMDALSKGSGNARSTALVLLNTRVIHSYNYKTVKDMVKKDSDGPWGNHFGFLHVAIPKTNDTNTGDPLEFVTSAKNIIQKKKNSLGVLLTGRLLELMRRYRGPEKTAEYIHSTLSNASMAITNLLGPVEKMSLANHPIKGLYFMVVNAPMNLNVTIVSYMGKLRLAVGADKELINHKIFCTSLETAFEQISKAASTS